MLTPLEVLFAVFMMVAILTALSRSFRLWRDIQEKKQNQPGVRVLQSILTLTAITVVDVVTIIGIVLLLQVIGFSGLMVSTVLLAFLGTAAIRIVTTYLTGWGSVALGTRLASRKEQEDDPLGLGTKD
jgi:Mn2+/Fe2+ NRAMP family transporter